MDPFSSRSPWVTHSEVSAADVPPNAIAMCTHAKNVRSLPRNDRGSIFMGIFRGKLLRRTAFGRAAAGVGAGCAVSSATPSSTANQGTTSGYTFRAFRGHLGLTAERLLVLCCWSNRLRHEERVECALTNSSGSSLPNTITWKAVEASRFRSMQLSQPSPQEQAETELRWQDADGPRRSTASLQSRIPGKTL